MTVKVNRVVDVAGAWRAHVGSRERRRVRGEDRGHDEREQRHGHQDPPIHGRRQRRHSCSFHLPQAGVASRAWACDRCLSEDGRERGGGQWYGGPGRSGPPSAARRRALRRAGAVRTEAGRWCGVRSGGWSVRRMPLPRSGHSAGRGRPSTIPTCTSHLAADQSPRPIGSVLGETLVGTSLVLLGVWLVCLALTTRIVARPRRGRWRPARPSPAIGILAWAGDARRAGRSGPARHRPTGRACSAARRGRGSDDAVRIRSPRCPHDVIGHPRRPTRRRPADPTLLVGGFGVAVVHGLPGGRPAVGRAGDADADGRVADRSARPR